MMATPKADECIRMLREIEEGLNAIILVKGIPLTDDRIEKLGGRKDTFRGDFDVLVRQVDYYHAIFYYRLLPAIELKWEDNSSFKHIKNEAEKDKFLSSISTWQTIEMQNDKEWKTILWEVLTKFDEVTLDDLKNEFWLLIPGMKGIKESYDLMMMKFRGVFSEIPDTSYHNYDVKNDPGFVSYFSSLIRYEIVSAREVNIWIRRLRSVLEMLNSTWSAILRTYESFLPDNSNSTVIPDELNTPKAKELLGRAIDNGLVAFDGSTYTWKGTKVLLAYFAEKTSKELHFGKMDENKEWRTNWIFFERAFNVKNLKNAKYTWLTDNYTDEFVPPGYEKVDALFK